MVQWLRCTLYLEKTWVLFTAIHVRWMSDIATCNYNYKGSDTLFCTHVHYTHTHRQTNTHTLIN